MTKPLTFNRLLSVLEHTFAQLPDGRTGQNVTYSLRDAAMAAFSVFFMQSPSFLAHQEAMQGRERRNNAASLFGIEKIPSDPQISISSSDARQLLGSSGSLARPHAGLKLICHQGG